MQIDHTDYLESGFRIMALHSVEGGICTCGDPKCKALFKHPRASNWQNTPHWSQEQIESMEQYGQLATGFGVLVDDHLVVDIDPRNGGFESYEKLQKDLGIDLEAVAGYVVETGGGGLHIYYSNGDNVPLVSHLEDYPGIDFKSSGFVVGCGSMHASGMQYDNKKGTPHDTAQAPDNLLELLKKKDTYRSSYSGQTIDLTDSELEKMLSYYSNDDLDYEDWIRCGMALHHATSGAGYDLWDKWSQNSSKYDPALMERKWHSFGKAANPVTIGSLIYHAQAGGYQFPVTFETDLSHIPQGTKEEYDLQAPPDFVGKVTSWINDQCRFPRERLAVAAALSAIGNIAGLRYIDADYGVTANNFFLCVAGSSTGKESVQQAQADIHRVAGVAPATHGAIKSEQEIIRNLILHQSALYIIDEIGITLQKIQNAKRSGASYLEAVIGVLMSAYSKANSYLLLSGDVREGAKAEIGKMLNMLNKKADEGHAVDGQIEKLVKQMSSLDSGLEKPFLSLAGYTTPVTFNSLVDYESATNGFIGRALLAIEKQTNPKAKKRFKPTPMSMPMQMALANLAATKPNERIEHLGDKVPVKSTEEALDTLDKMQDEFHELAEKQKDHGMEAVARRAFELTLKVSLVLAIPEGLRTLEHVRWARAYVLRDIGEKINLAQANISEQDKNHGEALSRRILAQLDTDHGETTGVITNRCRPHKREDVEKALAMLETAGHIVSEEGKRKNTKRWLLKS